MIRKSKKSQVRKGETPTFRCDARCDDMSVRDTGDGGGAEGQMASARVVLGGLYRGPGTWRAKRDFGR